MRNITEQETQQVGAALFLQLIGALVTVFVLPKVINDHRKEYNKWGQGLGEALYEHNHPYDPNK